MVAHNKWVSGWSGWPDIAKLLVPVASSKRSGPVVANRRTAPKEFARASLFDTPLLSGPLERVVDHADEVRGSLIVGGPFAIEINEWLCGPPIPLALAPATSSAMRSRADTSLARNAATCALLAGPPRPDDLGIVIRQMEKGIVRADHASDVATIAEVDHGIAVAVDEVVASDQHIGVREICALLISALLICALSI
jgi:hypothetical protein